MGLAEGAALVHGDFKTGLRLVYFEHQTGSVIASRAGLAEGDSAPSAIPAHTLPLQLPSLDSSGKWPLPLPLPLLGERSSSKGPLPLPQPLPGTGSTGKGQYVGRCCKRSLHRNRRRRASGTGLALKAKTHTAARVSRLGSSPVAIAMCRTAIRGGCNGSGPVAAAKSRGVASRLVAQVTQP